MSADADTSTIEAFLESFAADRNSGNPERIAQHYRSTVERYFLARNVSREWIEHDIAEGFSRGVTPTEYNVQLVGVQRLSPQVILATVRKNYSLSGETRSINSRLWLTNDEGSWLILGEQDLKS